MWAFGCLSRCACFPSLLSPSGCWCWSFLLLFGCRLVRCCWVLPAVSCTAVGFPAGAAGGYMVRWLGLLPCWLWLLFGCGWRWLSAVGVVVVLLSCCGAAGVRACGGRCFGAGCCCACFLLCCSLCFSSCGCWPSGWLLSGWGFPLMSGAAAFRASGFVCLLLVVCLISCGCRVCGCCGAAGCQCWRFCGGCFASAGAFSGRGLWCWCFRVLVLRFVSAGGAGCAVLVVCWLSVVLRCCRCRLAAAGCYFFSRLRFSFREKEKRR